jgi:hypothetical protein
LTGPRKKCNSLPVIFEKLKRLSWRSGSAEIEEDRMKKIILGIQITNRLTKALEVQKLFSQYGCNIKTRLGLHDVNENTCSPSGLVLLEMFGKEEDIFQMEKAMKAIEGIKVQKMMFE